MPGSDRSAGQPVHKVPGKLWGLFLKEPVPPACMLVSCSEIANRRPTWSSPTCESVSILSSMFWLAHFVSPASRPAHPRCQEWSEQNSAVTIQAATLKAEPHRGDIQKEGHCKNTASPEGNSHPCYLPLMKTRKGTAFPARKPIWGEVGYFGTCADSFAMTPESCAHMLEPQPVPFIDSAAHPKVQKKLKAG
jgi:hypothetical protein